MLYIDVKYVGMLSPYVRNFKKLKTNLWRMSCPICGDSVKNRHKARGYFFAKEQSMIYRCHNCGATRTIGSFLKDINQELYKEYRLETFKNGGNTFKFAEEKPKETPTLITEIKLSIPSIEALPENHPAKLFLVRRKIPDKFFNKFYFANSFKTWMHSVSEDYYPDEKSRENDYGRIVIPYFNESKKFFGFSCRALGNEQPKYIHGKIDKEADHVYGLDTVDKTKRVYVFEGQIDSLFIPNAIAVSGSSFLITTVKNLSDKVLCYDNERRKRETTNKMAEAIEKGYTVYIPPSHIKEKDVNDMIMAGYTADKIKHIIDENSFTGLVAKLKFSEWKK